MSKDEITTLEAAGLLKCSQRTVQRMIDRGSLHGRKIDPTAKSVYYVSRAEVEALLDRSRKAGKAKADHSRKKR